MWAGWNLDRMIQLKSRTWKSYPSLIIAEMGATWSPQEDLYKQGQDSSLCSLGFPMMCNPEWKSCRFWVYCVYIYKVQMGLPPGHRGLDKVWKGRARRSTHPHTAKPARGGPSSSWKHELKNHLESMNWKMDGVRWPGSYFWPVPICWREGGYVTRSRVSLTHPKYLGW